MELSVLLGEKREVKLFVRIIMHHLYNDCFLPAEQKHTILSQKAFRVTSTERHENFWIKISRFYFDLTRAFVKSSLSTDSSAFGS